VEAFLPILENTFFVEAQFPNRESFQGAKAPFAAVT
jgi:hypothetical protein